MAFTRLREAKRAGHAVTYAFAKDTISTAALAEKPGIGAEKASWLRRPDTECGDLRGVLPLVLGMPVALTGHIDRNPDKQLV